MTFVLHERAERIAPDRQGKVYAYLSAAAMSIDNQCTSTLT